MNRREALLATGAAAMPLALAAVAQTQDTNRSDQKNRERKPPRQVTSEKPTEEHRASAETADSAEHSKMFEECAKICNDCQIACDSCAHHCLQMVTGSSTTGEHRADHARCMEACGACAAACSFAACLSARQSEMSAHACECCAKCCDDCAEMCEKFPQDEKMIACAKECRDCAKACREMAENSHASH